MPVKDIEAICWFVNASARLLRFEKGFFVESDACRVAWRLDVTCDILAGAL
jgi:hypothetical protein